MSVRGQRFVEFWRENGTHAAARLIREKLGDAIAGRAVFGEGDHKPDVESVPQFSARRFISQQPLEVHPIPWPSVQRISLVTDSIGSESMVGGVGTALRRSSCIRAAHSAAAVTGHSART